MELVLFAFVVWACLGIAAYVVANNRGGSGCGYALLALLLGPIGLALAFLVGTRCPSCQKTISEQATTCPYCRADIKEIINIRASVSTARDEDAMNNIRCHSCNAKVRFPQIPKCPACGKATGLAVSEPSQYKWVYLLPLIFIVILWQVFSSDRKHVPQPTTQPETTESAGTDVLPVGLAQGGQPMQGSDPDELQPILKRYGEADRDDSTEHDPDHPLLPLRILEYRAQEVKIIFYPIGKIGEDAYPRWAVFGYIDLQNNSAMSSYDATVRLAKRRR
jgi:hypothetical protein